MGAAVSLVPELESVLHRGSRGKRADTLRRVTDLFLDDAATYDDAHVGVFGDIFSLLIEEIESKARAELAHRLAPVENAPVKVLLILAGDDDIAVAGPVLTLAPRLADADLVEFATTKGQAHLHAISARPQLAESVTDILVRRGDIEVARSLAGNRGARISESGFVHLVERAEADDLLAEAVGRRPEIPPEQFNALLRRATAVVRQRLLVSANSKMKAEIRRVLHKVSGEVGASTGPRDYRAAQRDVLTLYRAGCLDEAALFAFAAEGKYEEAVVALATLSKVPIKIVDRLMASDRPDPVLILCRATGMSWQTVKYLIALRFGGKSTFAHTIGAAFANYGRLSASTAQRVVRFWQLRPAG